jgi:hypothetical protein
MLIRKKLPVKRSRINLIPAIHSLLLKKGTGKKTRWHKDMVLYNQAMMFKRTGLLQLTGNLQKTRFPARLQIRSAAGVTDANNVGLPFARGL